MEKASVMVINKAFEEASPELQHLKKYSLSKFYQYLSKLAIENGSTLKEMNTGILYLRKSIKFNTKSLLKWSNAKFFIKYIKKGFHILKTAKALN